jgi:hypothetical protein
MLLMIWGKCQREHGVHVANIAADVDSRYVHMVVMTQACSKMDNVAEKLKNVTKSLMNVLPGIITAWGLEYISWNLDDSSWL